MIPQYKIEFENCIPYVTHRGVKYIIHEMHRDSSVVVIEIKPKMIIIAHK
jgi:hypothetical protein